ncbi:MAG: hypothetical protein RI580_05475 [Halothece sp. Uz-M2-17]|nr:hypothetical protein [Halothece sp. Uz-M2-17]
MPESNPSKDEFLYPHYPYRGEAQPKKIVFNANLQEFAQRVNYICNLETGGKISSDEAYRQIKELWKELKSSRKGLEMDQDNNES